MPKVRLYFCSITMSRWYQFEEVVKNIYSYVDKLVIIDGGSKDGTIKGLMDISLVDNTYIIYDENLNETDSRYNENAKMVIVDSIWNDNFPAQRQRYLDTVEELRKPDESSWVIVSDSDEYFSARLRKGLRDLIEWADGKGYDCITVRSKGITYDEKEEVTNLTYDDFYKPLIYKWNPGRKIVGTTPDGIGHPVHEGFSKMFTKVLQLPSKEEQGLDKELVYEHRKYPGDTWQRGHVRNFFIGGGGPNLGEMQLLWKPFRKLVNECASEDGFGEIETWWDYSNYLQKGNVNYRLKEWFIRYMYEGMINRPDYISIRNDHIPYPKKMSRYGDHSTFRFDASVTENSLGQTYDGSSEVREGAKYYFQFLHPEETPKELIELWKKYPIG